MSDLLTTAPLAFETFYGILQAAGAALSPAIPVMDQELTQYEPGSYVCLTGLENHRWEWSSLGTFAFEEDYDIVGYATFLLGSVSQSSVINGAFACFQSVVQIPMVNHRIPPISAALQSAGVTHIIPRFARYTSSPGSFGGGQGGFQGTVEFAYSVHARVTVP